VTMRATYVGGSERRCKYFQAREKQPQQPVRMESETEYIAGSVPTTVTLQRWATSMASSVRGGKRDTCTVVDRPSLAGTRRSRALSSNNERPGMLYHEYCYCYNYIHSLCMLVFDLL